MTTRLLVAFGVALASLGGPVAHAQPDVAAQMQCHGEPPRQTPDPLAPPCVPYFASDNGGATYRGVTRDQIVVFFYNDLGVEGELNPAWSLGDERPGHESSAHGEQAYLVRTIKAVHQQLGSQFQLYRRTVRLVGVSSSGHDCRLRQLDAEAIADREPFAVVTLGDQMDCLVQRLTDFDIPTIGVLRDLSRDLVDESLVWTFEPTLDEQSVATARFLCRKLFGRPARFSPDPSIAASNRRVVILYSNDAALRGPVLADQAAGITREVANECGIAPSADASTGLMTHAYSAASVAESIPTMAALRLLGVTSVLCLCTPVSPEQEVGQFQQAATSIGFFPEWVFDSGSRMYRSPWLRRYHQPEHVAIGLTPEWAVTSFNDTMPVRTVTAVIADGGFNRRFPYDIYYGLFFMYAGLQGSGPQLGLESLARGFAHMGLAGRSVDAHLPIGDFDGGRRAFRRTWLAWRWDPLGIEAPSNPGCLRATMRAAIDGEWIDGDADIGGPVCLGAHTEVSNIDAIPAVLPRLR